MSSTKRRTYLALFGICLTALVVDRMLGGAATEPFTVEASPVVPSGAAPSLDGAPPSPLPHIAFPTINSRADEAPRDFFAPPAKGVAPSGSPIGMHRAVNGALSREAFEGQAVLSGVLVSGHTRIAIVGGRRVAPGDSILGCRLERVLGRSASFVCFDGKAVLFIATPRGRGSN